jgi:NYN domain-containing protein
MDSDTVEAPATSRRGGNGVTFFTPPARRSATPTPNYDVLVFADAVCRARGWALSQARFYTGIPDPTDNPFWHHFWSAKLAVMVRQGVVVFSRSLRYRNQTVRLPDRSEFTFSVGEEKGVDIRMALDVIRMAHRGDYDVAVIVSQDQDFSEVAEEIRVIAQERSRWIKVASAYPLSPTTRNRRGINRTDWLPISRAMYDGCLDRRDYRPPR